jgi:hypothetical protein
VPKIFEGSNLAGGMALDGHEAVILIHAHAVVENRDLTAPTIDKVHLYGLGTGIYGVFDKFLDHRRRTFHHLTGSDDVSQVIGEDMNAITAVSH